MRHAFVGLAAGLLALGSIPALAASTPNQTSLQGAEAIWYLDQGGVATSVLIRPVQQSDHGPGSSGALSGVNVQVSQMYVDPATGDTVLRVYVSDPYYAPATSISVDGLKGASVQATVNLYEQAGGTGSYRVDVAATWAPTGGKTHTLNNVWDTEFGSWSANRTNQSAVEAIATGSMTGALEYGALGETDGTLATAHSFTMFRPAPATSALDGMLEVYAAEGRSTYHIDGATSTWVVGGDQNVSVDLSVEQDHSNSAASPPRTWIEVYGGYFDAATNEDVSFDLSSDAIPATTGSVDQSIQAASVSATYSVSGYEYRTSSTGDTTYAPVGPFTVAASASWIGTGALSHYRILFIERSPNVAEKERYYSKARGAGASGSVSGSVVTGALTDVQNAFMYDQARTIVTK